MLIQDALIQDALAAEWDKCKIASGALILAVACYLPACAAPSSSGEAPLVESPIAEAQGLRGFYAVRGQRVVAAQNADSLFVPASVNKLIVVAAALRHLGPRYRITTTLRADGELDDGVLTGDLILQAAGDPTWNRRFFAGDPRAPLRLLARRLLAAGVRRVTGDLVVDAGRFPGRPFPTSRPASEYAYGYAAPTSALAVDENAVRVEIAPGSRIGEPGTARLLAGGTAVPEGGERTGLPRLINRIRTVSKERHGAGTVDILPVWEGEAIVVRGEYPISEPPYEISLSVPSPELHAARHLARVLLELGIEVAGNVRLEFPIGSPPGEPASASAAEPILARLESPPLTQLLEPILTDSHNWYAEMLLRVLAAEVSGEGRLDHGLELERRFLEQEVACPPASFHLDDASGLSPYNLITPRCVVELLRYVRSQPWRTAFLAALAKGGEGTLEVWHRLPPVAAKTGSIRHTLALAGYLGHLSASVPFVPLRGSPSPEPVIFAVFLNHQPGERGPRRAEIASLLRRWVRRPTRRSPRDDRRPGPSPGSCGSVRVTAPRAMSHRFRRGPGRDL